MTDPLSHRRHHARIQFDAPGRLVLLDPVEAPISERTASVHLLDISLQGALVSRPDTLALRVGGAARLYIQLGGETGELAMDVEVAHLHEGRVGLACRQLDLEALTHLKRLVELNLGDEALLYRELAELKGPAPDAT